MPDARETPRKSMKSHTNRERNIDPLYYLPEPLKTGEGNAQEPQKTSVGPSPFLLLQDIPTPQKPHFETCWRRGKNF